MTDPRQTGNGGELDLSAATVSSPRILRVARELRATCWLIELGLYALLAGSVLAAAAAFPSSDVPLWGAALVLGALLLVRCGLVWSLRRLVGRRLFSFHPSRLWIVLDQPPGYRMPGWSFDLQRPLVPRGPLLLPGLGLLALALGQLLLLPPGLVTRLTRIAAETVAADPSGWLPLTVSVSHTRTGVIFLSWALLLHVVGAAVLDSAAARARFQRCLAGFGVLLTLIALAQLSTGTRHIYGLWLPPGDQGGNTVFGPFSNRNHFAAYMLMAGAASLDLLLRAFRRYRRRVGTRVRLRRWLVGLQSPEGTSFLFALLPGVTSVAGLVASTSRGGVLAFLGGLGVAGLALPARTRRVALGVCVALLVLVVAWFGAGPLNTRFSRLPQEAKGRSLVWSDTLARMPGLWLTGAGFNAFPRAMSRATVWALPRGATAWREPYETSIAAGPRLGYRAMSGLPGFVWYGHAHNDYLQMLVETGLPGLMLTLWAALAALRGAWREPWRLAALAGVLLQSLVDFPLHIPPVAALFVVVASSGGGARRVDRTETPRDGEAEELGPIAESLSPPARPA